MNNKILNKAKILIIGDIMLDTYIYGDVRRISPEAPVPVLNFNSQESVIGGAANVAKNISSLGSEATLISVVGKDNSGSSLIGMIGAVKNITAYIKTDRERATTLKSRYISHGQQIMRMDYETIMPIGEVISKDIIKIIEEEVSRHDAVIISDYDKGVLDSSISQEMYHLIQSAKIPVVIDTKTKDYSKYENAFLITPNVHEIYNATGKNNVIDAAEYLIDKYHIKNVLVTQGENGMTLVRDNLSSLHIDSEAKEVVDITGAGDTVASVMAIGLANLADINDCIKLANKAAGLVVKKSGAASVTREELSWISTLH